MLKEFKNFIMTGNVIDLAVAVILAGATGLVVKSFVTLIMMPIVGHFAGGVDFADFKIVLDVAVIDEAGNVSVPENAILYGEWINNVINLLTVGLVLFVIVKVYAQTKKVEEAKPAAPPAPSKEELLLTEIRDLLKK